MSTRSITIDREFFLTLLADAEAAHFIVAEQADAFGLPKMAESHVRMKIRAARLLAQHDPIPLNVENPL